MEHGKLLLAAVFLAFSCAIYGESPFTWHYTEADGLASNNVYCAFQDSQSYMWFGTDKGVCRFDGARFECFTIQDGLTDLEVFQIHEDSQGRIWFLTYSGIPCFYKDGIFHNPSNAPFLAQVDDNSFLSSFTETSDGSVYLSTFHGNIYRITQQHEVMQIPMDVMDEHVSVRYLWNINDRVYASMGPNWIYDLSRRELSSLLHDSIHDVGRFLYEDDLLFGCFFHEVYIFNRGLEPIDTLALQEDERIIFIGPGFHSGELSVASRSGVRFLDKDTRSLSAKHLEGLSVTMVFRDRRGGVWASTLEDGVFYAPSRGIVNLSKSQIPDPPVYSLTTDGTDLWFGASSAHFGKLSNDSLTFYESLESTLGGMRRVLDIYPREKSKVIRMEKELFVFDSETGLTSQFCAPGICFSKDDKGVPWVGGLTGVTPFHCDYKRMNADHYLHYIGQRVFDMVNDSVGTMILGTTDGLYRLQLDGGEHWRILEETRNKRVEQLFYAGDLLVAGVPGHGVYVYRKGVLVSVLTEAKGLVSSNILRIKEDPQEGLWIVCDNGLTYLPDPHQPAEQLEWRTFTSSNGLPMRGIQDIAFLQDRIYIASDMGVTRMDTFYLSNGFSAPVLNLKSIHFDGESLPLLGSRLELPRGMNSFVLSYGGVAFPSVQFQYRYRINQGAWQESELNQVNLAGVSPGEYQFDVAVRNDFADWSETKSVTVSVTGYFWQSEWFVWVKVVLIVSLLWGIWRIQRILRQHRWLRNTLQRWAERLSRKSILTLKTSSQTVRVPIDKILWIKSESNYCAVVTKSQRIMVLATLKSFEKRLEHEKSFLRVHRSYIVNLNHVSAAKRDRVTIIDTVIPVGETHQKSFKQYIDGLSKQVA